jgi:hypothetical protein
MGYVTALVVLQAAIAASPSPYYTALGEAQENSSRSWYWSAPSGAPAAAR